MRQYLLDTTLLSALLFGRTGAVSLIYPWIVSREVVTSILVYGEVIEYLRSFPDFPRRRTELRRLLRGVYPLALTYGIVERYSEIRRALRRQGPGLIGDIDTLIAATALEYDLTVVTADLDFQRVPSLKSTVIPRQQLSR
jgi:predicted nucleic acid-binding protein